MKGRVVFFHGNAENISTHFGSIHWLPKEGYEVLAVDYRGYGKSTGVPILPEILSDMQLAYQWMLARSEKDKLPVFVLGQSIGASLTTMAVAQLEEQPECIVLDAGFASFSDMARISFQRSWLFWPFAYPASWLLPSDLNPEDYAGQIQSRVLQFHSPDDQVVPYDQGRLLMNQFPKVTWVDSSGPHITTFNHTVNRKTLLDFYGACGAH
ncbi:hypothetical protein GCM10007876_26650 [Litoribrevibacter albus]|uniref:Serine aminopeptidase S33 domain-containing protein n=1 Tax=Litoribrevibacter albus TaxID=1473156 RepID=A0AA37W922_9GAMM|nr:hypothetical protein GCM10007876_26650 [Litoribrevibacter albus]